jgi:extracellular factor (EF) 3-hydroxypalmitic acid methyl ester biosynthesis protein
METARKKKIQLIDTRTEVSLQEKTFLVHGTRQVPIQAECASKYSIFFRYLDGHHLPDSDEPIKLLIRNNGQSVELGPCRILPSPDLKEYAGRLVFMNDVYDVECLLSTNKAIKLQAPFKELPAVMARKEKILPSFKPYTADLSYDLSAYKKVFDDLDLQYHEEPDDVRRSIQQAIIVTEGSKFIQFFHEKVEELEQLVAGFSQEEHQLHGFYFRKQLWEFILCCALMARTNLKPRGYAGDSEMMKMIYMNGYQGETTFCKLMQKYTVGVPASQSVRNRRKLIMEILTKFRESFQLVSEEKIRVLSVACGPAFELADILKSTSDFQKYNFTLLDQDSIALKEAGQFISDIEEKYGQKIQAEYANMSVRLMFSRKSIEQQLGKFHFIYSMGLFDYLSTPVAKAVLEKLYQLLIPGGELVIGNFHVSNPSKYFMEYWGDWYLMHRTEEEFKDLLKDLNSAAVSIIFEDTRSQMFLHAKRQAGGL